MTLHVDLTVRDIHAAFTVPAGTTTALLGPNGAGKSSVLRAIAGTVPASGAIDLAGRDLTAVPTHRRRVGLLGQRPHLFGHLSVLDNVAFGPRAAGRPRRAARAIAAGWLDRFGAEAWATRRPDQLSGGEQQRVALARALAADPAVLLLDEPFAAIDAAAVDELRELVRRTVTTTCVLVTHSLPDAVALADDAVVLEAGRVVDHGPATEVLAHPRSHFVARLAGTAPPVTPREGDPPPRGGR